MQLELARHEAETFVGLIVDCCQIVTIAGSIRRKQPDVGDVEIVAVPKVEIVTADVYDLFGTTKQREIDLLAERLSGLIRTNQIVLDTQLRRNGPRYKRFFQNGIAIDLFIAGQNSYGNILALRTGNADFSRALVTPRRHGGLMPATLEHAAGYLWRSAERIDCPTEESFFDALGVEWLAPELRDGAKSAKWTRGVRPTT